MPKSPAGSLRDDLNELRKRRILEVATELIRDQGYTATSMDQISESLAISKPYIYSYFDSKEAILFEISKHVTEEGRKAMQRVFSMDTSPLRKIEYVVEEIFKVAFDHWDKVVIFNRDKNNLTLNYMSYIESLTDDSNRILDNILKEGVEKGDFDLEDFKVARLSLVGMLSSIYAWYKPDGRLSRDVLVRQMSELALRLVGAKRQLNG